jgi:hypothetical protein
MRFLFVILLYGGIQAYFSGKVIQAFSLVGTYRILAVGFALLMTFGPFLIWRLERCAECHVLAVSGAWLVYSWMGFVFLFFWLGLLLDLYGVGAHLLDWSILNRRSAFLILSAVATVFWFYGFYVARHPQVERIVIESSKLPAGFAGLRIVQISDVHLGLLAGRQRLDAILEQVAALQPDILVSTGDLVDAEAQFLDGLSARFAAYQPRYGKFAVTGNHEHYAGLAHALDFHRRSGFTMLQESVVDVAEDVTLAGVDDPAILAGPTHESKVLSSIPANHFVILLKHQPTVAPDARFDLQLSGHTHAGQIFPFGLLVKQIYPSIQGLHNLASGGQLYVSRGTGTWGPPIRIGAPPEITLITLQRPH